MSMFTPFSELTVKHLKTVLRELQKPLLAYSIIETTIGATEAKIEHKLGRAPFGYIVISRSASCIIYGNVFTDKLLMLTSSADATIKLLVF